MTSASTLDGDGATTLGLATARSIIEATLAHRRALGAKPLAVAVLDAGGHLLALQREDGAGLLSPKLAIGKAAGALGMGYGSRQLAERAERNPSFIAAATALAPSGLVPVPGGVLVRTGQQAVIGAVGASGDTSDRDEACAVTGISSAGLYADTG